MPPKKNPRKRKRRSKKAKPKKVDERPNREYYETIIVDLNRRLAQLRTELFSKEQAHETLRDTVRSTVDDHFNASEHLKRLVSRQDERLTVLEQQQQQLDEQLLEEDTAARERIHELERRFVQTLEVLRFERQLAQFRLNTWSEYREQMHSFYGQLEELEGRIDQRAPKFRIYIRKLKRRHIEEWRKRYFESRVVIAQFKTDYISCADVRFAAYVTRLIEDNLKSRTDFEELTVAVFQKVLQKQSRRAQFDPLQASCELERDLKGFLERTARHQQRLMRLLQLNYDKLQTKYTETLRYKQLYEVAQRRDLPMQRRLRPERAIAKLQQLKELACAKSVELQRMQYRQEELAWDIAGLHRLIQRYEHTVQAAAKSFRQMHMLEPPPGSELHSRLVAQCSDLLTELIQLLGSSSEVLPAFGSRDSLNSVLSSIYQVGDIGIFYRPQRSASPPVSFVAKPRRIKQTPVRRPPSASAQSFELIDVEMGRNSLAFSLAQLRFKRNEALRHRFSATMPIRQSLIDDPPESYANSLALSINATPSQSSVSGLTIGPSSEGIPPLIDNMLRRSINKYNIK